MSIEDDRKTTTLQIDKQAHAEFLKTCKARNVGRSMSDVGSRLIGWFNRQKPLIQTAVVTDVDDGMELAYADALERLASELREKYEKGRRGHKKHDGEDKGDPKA